LTQTDKQKIEDFKRQFMPNFLPDDILANGLFITGEEVSI